MNSYHYVNNEDDKTIWEEEDEDWDDEDDYDYDDDYRDDDREYVHQLWRNATWQDQE